MSFKYKDKLIAGSGGGSEEVYSTKEVKIGTWIDGRPLYRVCGVKNLQLSLNTKYAILNPIDNLQDVIHIEAMFLSETGSYQFAPVQIIGATTPNFSITVWYQKPNFGESPTGLCVYAKHAGYQNSKIMYLIEYTKTTDQATIQLQESLQTTNGKSQEYPNSQDFTAPVTAGI